MLILYFKLLLTPVVYLLLFLRSLVKWILVIPLMFILHFIKRAFIWVLVAIAAAYVATPIAAAVVAVIALFFTLPKALADAFSSIPAFLRGGWNYPQKIIKEINAHQKEKRRIKYEKQVLKQYAKVENEFIGFNQIADVFVSLKD